jgi:hypothetical protein
MARVYFIGVESFDLDVPEQREDYFSRKRKKLRSLGFLVPAIHGDAIYKGLDDGFGNDNDARSIARAAALAGGVNPEGKRYVSGLVRPEVGFGDPLAWVDKGEARSQIKKRCEERGWGCEGAVTTTIRPAECGPTPMDQYEVADDIVDAEVVQTIQRDKLAITPSEKAVLRVETKKRLSGNK